MQTERTIFQPAHVDYDYPILKKYGNKLFLAFFPLTEDGAFLQLWKEEDSSRIKTSTATQPEANPGQSVVEGTVVYIPYEKMLIVPSNTIHAGGFKRGESGNLRFHLYIAVEDGYDVGSDVEMEEGKEGVEGAGREEILGLLNHPMNKYTEENDRRRELCERFVDANGLEHLLGVFFDS